MFYKTLLLFLLATVILSSHLKNRKDSLTGCSEPFLLRNWGSGAYLSFGNIFPYDGNRTPHYGSGNYLTDNSCDNRIKDRASKIWRICLGSLRSDSQVQPGGYSSITNDVIRKYSVFAKVNPGPKAYLDSNIKQGYVAIKLEGTDHLGNNKDFYLYTDPNLACNTNFVWKDQLNLNPQTEKEIHDSAYFFWNMVYDINDPNLVL